MEGLITYLRDALFMADLGAWQVWQHLEFRRLLALGYDDEPPDGGGTPLPITALWRRYFFDKAAKIGNYALQQKEEVLYGKRQYT